MEEYDVVICGAGLAGLTLARQLRLEHGDDFSILMLERTTSPLPRAAFKVGESTVEVGASYLADVLDLRDYFDADHLPKFGLRYFFGNPEDSFEDRPEYGLSKFSPVKSYQMDRGLLESDLRKMNREHGVVIRDGVTIRDMHIGKAEEPSRIEYVDSEGKRSKVMGRWLVDATGRGRLLQKKLELRKEHDGVKCSAAWFRVAGDVRVTDLVDGDDDAWHGRVMDDRHLSTNHLMGDGRWVWTIPLVGGTTSIGIVASDEIHPFSSFSNQERALSWLREHEPRFAELIDEEAILDFRVMRDYSHDSRQVLSTDRWACVGEAGVFADPFYSPGADMMGFGNCCTSYLIGKDLAGEFDERRVSELDHFILGYNRVLQRNIQSSYAYHGDALVMGMKILWDTCVGWSTSAPMMFTQFYLDEELAPKAFRAMGRFTPLSLRMQRFFIEWSERTNNSLTYDYFDYLSTDFVQELRTRNLVTTKDAEQLVEDQKRNLHELEILANAIFSIAVQDVLPEHHESVMEHDWLNAWGIGLDPEKWDSAKLFGPKTKPGDYHGLRDAIMESLHESESPTADDASVGPAESPETTRATYA